MNRTFTSGTITDLNNWCIRRLADDTFVIAGINCDTRRPIVPEKIDLWDPGYRQIHVGSGEIYHLVGGPAVDANVLGKFTTELLNAVDVSFQYEWISKRTVGKSNK